MDDGVVHGFHVLPQAVPLHHLFATDDALELLLPHAALVSDVSVQRAFVDVFATAAIAGVGPVVHQVGQREVLEI